MRTRFKRAITFLLITGLAALAAPSIPVKSESQPITSDALQSFERFVAERMAFDRIPGLSVGFIKGDFIWARGFGWADVENQAPARPESSYRLASVTKTITAVAVLKLVEEGMINLDAEIQAYVPYFPRKKWPVTVRQLLGHIGGISHYRNDAVEGHIKEPKNTRQALAIFKDFGLVAEPGTKYNYSSYGYNLLGAAVEGASGRPYGDFIKKNIFEPLGMSDSRLDDPLEIIPNRVRGYQIEKGELKNSEYVDISSRFAAGGTRSTILDLLKYARGIIDRRILRETTWRQMFTPLVVRNGFMTEYGLGWGVRPLNGHFAVSHSGSQPETRTQILIFPAEAFSVAIACNLEGANLLPYARRLVDLVLDEESGLTAYAPDRVRQSIYEGVSYAYDYGLSHYLWAGSPLSKDRGDLGSAFDYFLESASQKSLEKDYDRAKKKILAGVHPSAGQAFIKVGSYMAWALEEENGKGSLQAYHRGGPIAFFSDYIRLSTAAASPKRHPRLNGEFSRLMAEWENDWAKTHTEEIQRLVITPGADFETLIPKLKEEFAGAAICPDITSDLAGAADYFLKKNDGERAVSVLALGRQAYPASPSLAASLGYALIWSGRAEEGQKLYLLARELDPAHPVLKADQFVASMKQLVRIGKKKEALDLGLIAVEVDPKEPILYVALGDLSMLSGRRDKAAEYFREALRIDPDFEDAKTRLESLEK